VHAQGDPVVSPAAQHVYAATVAAAGRRDLLAQVRTDESDHSRLNDATLTTALRGLERWLDEGEPPTPEGMQRLCRETATVPADCRFLP
jgi:hypothetical protein